MATVDIKINNKTYSGVSSVNLPLADGSGYAPFNLDSSHIITKCSITYDLTDVTSSNTATSIASGSSFETTLSTSLEGRIVSGVVVTMGGTTLSGVYDSSTGVISISEVTDDISITATTAVDLRAPVFSITTPTVFDTTTSAIDTGLYILDEDRDWSICFDVETLTNSTNGQIISLNAPNNYNNLIVYISGNRNANFLWCDKTVSLGTMVWLGEKAGNITKAVITHVAGSGNAVAKVYAKNVAGRVDNVEKTITEATFTANTVKKLLVGMVSSGSYQVNSVYIYYRVLDADEISAYIAHEG